MSNNNLESCPFCRSPCMYEDGGFNAVRVTCTNYDGCTSKMRVHKTDPECQSKLADHWNHRACASSIAGAPKRITITSNDLNWFEDVFRAWECNDMVGVLNGLDEAINHFVAAAPQPMSDSEKPDSNQKEGG
jgi:hypothetical protein